MTAAQIATRTSPRAREPSRAWALLKRYSPSQGWPTLFMLIAVLSVVGDSVDAANWVKTPGLFTVLFVGAITGLLLAKVKRPAAILHLAALGIGTVVVVWQASSLIDGQPLVDQVQIFWARLRDWYTAAVSGGISTDLLPFTLLILIAAWILGYLSSWFIFRSNNVWVGVVLAAIAILTNHSFLPRSFDVRFFMFMFFAMLLVVRVSVVQQHEAWRKAQIRFDPLVGWMTIHAAAWLTVAVIIVAAVVPLNVYKSSPLSDAWNVGRSPIASLEDEFGRLFGAIPSRMDLVGRIFGNTLPFLGKIHMDGDVVLWAKTKYPSYWTSQTYSEYTSKGWVAGDTVDLEIGPDSLPPPRVDWAQRESIEQSLQLTFETSDLLSGGSLDWVSRDAIAKTLKPKEFEIRISDPSRDAGFPEDIQQLARELRQVAAAPTGQSTASAIAKAIPSDLTLISSTRNSQATDRPILDTVVVQRKVPLTPEVVSLRFSENIKENEPYTMVSSVSVAGPDDLTEAGTEYGGFITDHYLQLPASLPQRVHGLATEITRDAETPYDKAQAIQSYLRGSDFVYSQKIKAPPQEADGVDHFLFETRTGYSDYFASAMTVMLRATGVPARLAAGYAPGEFDSKSSQYFVRDTDSHAWVQIYFPSYGWIDFEPTPAWDLPGRDTARGAGSEEDSRRGELGLEDAEDIFPADDPFNPEDLEAFGGGSLSSGRSADVLVRAAIGAGSAAALWLVLYLVWNQGLWRAGQIDRAYAKMGRLGALAGLRRRKHQTPAEYAASIGRSIPGVAASAERIARAFADSRYGQHDRGDETDGEIVRAWRSIRVRLAGHALRRLVRLGGGQAQ
ncbi:MAG: transglutaminase domain-containing protein [Chloroflexi bacterium]|nr:transglutaminase domain-containing protein [Chloroflexota bacterium]